MNQDVTDNLQVASSNGLDQATVILEKLLARAGAAHQPRNITVIEEWVKAQPGYCRVAVIISAYGTHIEIGPVRGADSQITWAFREKELVEAEALLAGYFGEGR